jgi:ribosome-binding protein aMBF1 (putative translation factor)
MAFVGRIVEHDATGDVEKLKLRAIICTWRYNRGDADMTTSKGREVNPEAVRYYREKLGMTQEDLAEKSKLGRKTIQKV